MRALMTVCLVVALAGCAERLAAPAPPREVKVAVPVSCVPDSFPAAGHYASPDDLLSAPDAAELFRRLWADWLARVQRMAQTEPLVKHCTQLVSVPSG